MAILVSIVTLNSYGQKSTESFLRFEQPILMTSAGQSADVQIGGVLAKKAGLLATLSKNATQEELLGIKTLILVIGVSMKGLGAAGLDLDQEKTRVKELIEEAQKNGIGILCFHLGGDARRGELSDRMIEACLPHAQTAVVVKSGNRDSLFTKICEKNNIPLIEVDRASDVLDPLKDLFPKNR